MVARFSMHNCQLIPNPSPLKLRILAEDRQGPQLRHGEGGRSLADKDPDNLIKLKSTTNHDIKK